MPLRSLQAAAAICSLLGLLFSSTAHAQQVDLNHFRPTETARDGFAVSTASDQGHLRFGAQLYTDFAGDALSFDRAVGGKVRVVHRQLTEHLVLSLGLWSRVIVFAGLPYHALLREKKGDNLAALAASLIQPPNGGGLGDAYTGVRVRLFGTEQDPFALALQGTLTLGTASLASSSQRYRGMPDQGPRLSGEPELIGTFNAAGGRVRVSFNTGYLIRHNTSIGKLIAIGDELTFGVGGVFDVLRGDNALDLIAEFFGRTGLGKSTGSTGFFDSEETPLEILAGAKYHHQRGWSAGLGGGLGILNGYGAPNWRMLATIGYTMPSKQAPKTKEQEPRVTVPRSQPAIPKPSKNSKDFDADGLPDSADACVKTAEDFDNFDDSDGCPELDNDADGITDKADRCSVEPEDKDGYQDSDGCPDYDNDGDDIIDSEDKCPDEAGKKKYGGCPSKSDRDHDGVLDDEDNCPDEAGTADNHGCKTKQLVEIQDRRIQILESVYFGSSSAQILSRSNRLLKNVASVLKAHPEIKKLQVEGHTDARGSATSNLTLSQRRAESVVKFLIKQGVEAKRLQAKGFGGERPLLQDAKTATQHAQNRRVEFNILKD